MDDAAGTTGTPGTAAAQPAAGSQAPDIRRRGTARRPGRPGLLRRRPWLVPALLLAILVFMTVQVRTGGPLVSLDERIRTAVQAVAQSQRWHWVQYRKHSIANTLVGLGETEEAVPVLVLAAVAAAVRQRSARPLLAAAAGLALLIATVIPAKILIGRTGPGLPPLPPGQLGSFPSGHTATAALCYILAAMLLAPLLPRWLGRAIQAAAVTVTVIVGAALIWCDDHWVTDVLASLALVAIILWLTRWLTRQRPGWLARARIFHRRAGRPEPGSPGREQAGLAQPR